jgi:predicted nucleic acid-binding Zn ribbon protein
MNKKASKAKDDRSCAYCDEPIPESRGNASTCSEGCARSLKREQRTRQKERDARRKERLAKTEEETTVSPSGDVFELRKRRASQPHQAAPGNTDFDKVVESQWIRGKTFIEVRKWDRGSLDSWNGDNDDPGWVVVPPSREYTPLLSLQLEQAVLNKNPSGGHFQVRIYDNGVREAVLKAGPFNFHFSPMLSKELSHMKDILPLLESSQASKREEIERLREEIKDAKSEQMSGTAFAMRQMESALQQTREEARQAREEAARLRREEEERRLQERQFQMEQETRREEARLASQQNGMAQLSSTLQQMMSGGGGGFGGDSQTMAMLGMMFKAQMEQQQIQQQRQIEQSRIDREQSQRHMELMIQIMQGNKEESPRMLEDLRRMEEKHAKLEERYLNLVERRNEQPQLPPGNSGDSLDGIIEQMEKIEKVRSIFGGGTGSDEGGKDMFDRALDVLDKIGANKLGEAVAARISSGDNGTAAQPQNRELPEARTQAPSAQLNASNPQPSNQEQPQMTETNTQSAMIHPSAVASAQDAMVSAAGSFRSGMPPEEFAKELPAMAREQLAAVDVNLILTALKKVPEMATPRARRWVEDAHRACKG